MFFVLIYDFANLQTEESARELKALLDTVKADVSILVNNVGVLPLGPLDESAIEPIN